MDEEIRKIVSDILASEDKQIQVDALRIVEKQNLKRNDKDKAYKVIQDYLTQKRKRRISNRSRKAARRKKKIYSDFL